MPRSSSSFLFALVLCFALALVGWWTTFLVLDARAMEVAGAHLVNGDADAAARSLGADGQHGLAALGARRRAMFLSEGTVFGLILIAGGVLFFTALRREARMRADQDRFLAGATHELKTPLATIRLLLESLRDDRLPMEKRARYLESGLREADRLERGLTNVLTSAGLRTAVRPLRPEPGDLADDVRQAIAATTPRAEAAGIELTAGELPPSPCPRDQEALQLILRNLLDNAVKYSPAGTKVGVSLARSGDTFTIIVSDHGRGMDGQELQHAFQPFWRGKDTASGGVGLGLHLARELAAAHGGSLTAASDGADRGSAFTLRLPAGGKS